MPVKLAGPGGDPRPRSWAAQERAVDAAVAEALAAERAQAVRQAARTAQAAGDGAVGR